MAPKEFQESNLAVELKSWRKRLEEALRGLSEEQWERPGATRSGSVVDLLSGIVTKEFLTLMEVSDRLPSLPMNLPAKADGQTRSLPCRNGLNKSVENLLTEFGVLRSAVIRRIGSPKGPAATFDGNYAHVADVCVNRNSTSTLRRLSAGVVPNRRVQRIASPGGGAEKRTQSGDCGVEPRGLPGGEFRF